MCVLNPTLMILTFYGLIQIWQKKVIKHLPKIAKNILAVLFCSPIILILFNTIQHALCDVRNWQLKNFHAVVSEMKVKSEKSGFSRLDKYFTSLQLNSLECNAGCSSSCNFSIYWITIIITINVCRNANPKEYLDYICAVESFLLLLMWRIVLFL